MWENGLRRELTPISKLMTSQTEKQIITMRILPNISRSKSNKTTEVGQLIENNIRNISLEKSYKKVGREASPRPFSKTPKLRISLDQQSEISYSLFLLYVEQIEVYQNTIKLRC